MVGRSTSIPRPGHRAVLADTGGDLLVRHHYADNSAALLGVDRLNHDVTGCPSVS